MSDTAVALDLTVQRAEGDADQVSVPVSRIVNCGWTGRDEEAVRAHIEELEKEGVTAPSEFPVLYPKPYHLITNRPDIEVISGTTSGEAEFVMFPREDDVYVGVGSDHTDRDLETESIVLSKTVCPNVVGDELWALSDVEDHWDEIELRSWVGRGPDRELYQEDTLDAILPPRELLDLVGESSSKPLREMAVFSGSVATETEELVYSDVFSVELRDPVLARSLTCEYAVREID